MADFKKIFERFASAEQVTAGIQDDSDEEAGEAGDKEAHAKADKGAEASSSDSGSEDGGEAHALGCSRLGARGSDPNCG